MSSSFKMGLKTVFVATVALASLVTPALADGGGGTGGGTTVGNELTEDINMQGAKQISPAELEKLAEPILDKLATKLPDFAEKLRQGFTNINWYTDTKPFNPAVCDDPSMFDLHQVIRACQDQDSIRISKKFYDSHSKLLGDIIVHELVVHAAQRFPIDKDVLKVSAAVRDPSLSAEQLQPIVNTVFPYQWTASQKHAFLGSVQQALCPLQPGAVSAQQGQTLAIVITDIESRLENSMESEVYGQFNYDVDQEGSAADFLGTEVAISAQFPGVQDPNYPKNYAALQDEVRTLQSKYGCSKDGSLDVRADSTTMSKADSSQENEAPANSGGSSSTVNAGTAQ